MLYEMLCMLRLSARAFLGIRREMMYVPLGQEGAHTGAKCDESQGPATTPREICQLYGPQLHLGVSFGCMS